MRQERENEDLDLILERKAQKSRREYAGDRSAQARRRLNSDHGDRQRKYDDRRPMTKEQIYRRNLRRKKRRRQMIIARTAMGTLMAVLLAGVIFGLFKLGSFIWQKSEKAEPVSMIEKEDEEFITENKSEKPEILQDFLTPNEFSRPGEKLPEVTEIFVHYTANAGTSAAQNRSYFENLGITGETSASAHFVIGYQGEIIQCIPLNEIAYAVKEHNYNSISIECCYQDESGKFTDETYQSLLKLLGWLMNEYDLGPSAVWRHYDASKKLCPKYYVEHEEAWLKLKEDLKNYVS